MKPGDLVVCKELVKATGVMGSTLKAHKLFFGYGLILKIKDDGYASNAKVMLSNSKILSIKSSYLEVVQ